MSSELTSLFEPSLLIEGPFCNKMPDPKYWLAVQKAKKLIGTISKDHELPKNAGKKAGRKFSTYNDWIDQCEPHLDACGLIFQQSSSIVQFPSFPGGPPPKHSCVVKFLMIHMETGTGMIYRMDWPLWGFQGPAPDDRGAALGYAIKYGLRGILNISQTDEKDEVSTQVQRPWQQQQQQPAPQPQKQNGGPPQNQGPAQFQGNRMQPGQPGPQGRMSNGYGHAPAYSPPNQNAFPQQGMNPQFGGGPPSGPRAYGQQPPQQQGIDFRQHMNRPPQQPPQQQQQQPMPPMHMDPVIQEAHSQLGPNSPPSPSPDPYQAPAAQDGLRDPVFEDLMSVGWNEELARNISSIPADEMVPQELATLFHDAVVKGYFQGDVGRANALWFKDENGPDTGFVPQPNSGIFPTGAQMRRYCIKLNWNTHRSTSRTGA